LGVEYTTENINPEEDLDDLTVCTKYLSDLKYLSEILSEANE